MEFIRTLNWKILTSDSRFSGNNYGVVSDTLLEKSGNLFFVDGEKIIFCGPQLIDGCKTTYGFIYISRINEKIIEDFCFHKF